MSRKYKFHDKEGLYFISFATVYWIDVFVRDEYFQEMAMSLDHCRRNKGMELYAWCIMSSHLHLVIRSKDGDPSALVGNMKRYTSNRLRKLLDENPTESRKEWICWMQERAASKSSNVEKRQFWQHHNKPIALWSDEVIQQKIDNIHNNPVEAGFVWEPWHWKYSSAIDYSGGKGVIEIDPIR